MSSTIIRSAVFLPTPGMLESARTSRRASDATRSSGDIPDITVWASFGPMPETAISFRKSRRSRSVQKPKSASASSRTWVWTKNETTPPGSIFCTS